MPPPLPVWTQAKLCVGPACHRAIKVRSCALQMDAKHLITAKATVQSTTSRCAHTFMDEGFTFCKFLRKSLDEEFIV